MTRDTWHVTRDTWHVTRDTFGGVNILSKFQLPSSYRLWFLILWRSGGKGSLNQSISESVTRLFVGQPRLHRVCQKGILDQRIQTFCLSLGQCSDPTPLHRLIIVQTALLKIRSFERQTSISLEMLSIKIMLGFGQCGNGWWIIYIRLDTAILLEWLHLVTQSQH